MEHTYHLSLVCLLYFPHLEHSVPPLEVSGQVEVGESVHGSHLNSHGNTQLLPPQVSHIEGLLLKGCDCRCVASLDHQDLYTQFCLQVWNLQGSMTSCCYLYHLHCPPFHNEMYRGMKRTSRKTNLPQFLPHCSSGPLVCHPHPSLCLSGLLLHILMSLHLCFYHPVLGNLESQIQNPNLPKGKQRDSEKRIDCPGQCPDHCLCCCYYWLSCLQLSSDCLVIGHPHCHFLLIDCCLTLEVEQKSEC